MGIIGTFFLGVLQIYAALWIFRRIFDHVTNHDNKAQRDHYEAEIKHAKLITSVGAYRDTPLQIGGTVDDAAGKEFKRLVDRHNNTELDKLVLQDAMNRELRAKAALIAVLQQQGCTQTQIDEVMSKVDNQQHEL
jgi:hypothetical protein